MKDPRDMDYKEAAQALKIEFEQTGIDTKISQAVFSKEPSFSGDKPWPHFKYQVSFAKNGKSFSVDYSMGASKEEEIGPSPSWWHPTPSSNRCPIPAEVFACICSEAIEAREQSFEEWCGNFGYDNDSRRAEKIYNLCASRYHELRKVATDKEIQRFADLSRAL